MAHSFTNLLYHIVFATKGREPWLIDSIRPELLKQLGILIKEEGGIPLIVNGMPEHVHILMKLRPDVTVSKIVGDAKSRSSGWVHRTQGELSMFAWQTGYGAFTVSQSQVPRVHQYIEHQEEHHRERPYVEEFRILLRKNGFDEDEEFFWE